MSKKRAMIASAASFFLLAWSIQAQSSSQLVNTANILMRVYQATGGTNWRNATNWNSNNPNNVCNWAGVQCWSNSNSNTAIRGQVRSVSLANNKLVGTVPSTLWSIPYLQALDIRDNPDVDLDLTNVANANFLEYLYLSNSGITDLSQIGDAQYLVSLYITECNLNGGIPRGIFALTYLQGLYANFNNFDSTIPTAIGQLTELQELYLYNTALTGTIPSQIGLLTKLQVLALSDNYMSGTIPSEIRNLSNLRVLALQKDPSGHYGTSFSGRIPSFSTFTSLSELYLSHNSFTGLLPSSFLRNAPVDQIITVDLSYNQISGTITSNLSRLNYLNIYLVGNMISNIDQGICNSNFNWMNGAVGAYGCDAILCPEGMCAPQGRATDSDVCSECNYDYFGGTPQLSGMTQKEILLKFYSDTNGPSWYVERGEKEWLASTYECSWLGITCDGDEKVTEINLENRTLTGYPGSDIFSLPNLNYLNLGNNLIQFDFDGISKAVNLEYLYLHSCGLKELKNINQLAYVPLKELALDSNSLARTIPGVMYTIETLESIWLSYNKFYGTISTNIGLLTNLKVFYAYANTLTGTIPSEIGLLQESLRELVLSENDLTGTLPSTLNDMWVLEFLSIHQTTNSRGGLSGPLINFNSCNSLTSIHLNSNSLTGRIPSGFLRFSDHKNEAIDIDLSNNQLTGTLPSTWSILTDLFIDLTGNKITSVAAQLCDMTYWQYGEVANSCDAILCPIGTYNDYGRMTSDQECLPCASAQYMGTNICGQKNNQRSSLFKLYFSLYGWSRNSKWGTGTNECTWAGIDCDSYGNVISIDVSNQGLYGTPSNALFNLPLLSSLTFSQNEVNFDFTGIENAANLKTLYLSDCIVDSLTGIGKSSSLENLHLTSNKLTGTIPLELFRLSQLKYLYLSYNSFSGRLPSQIGELTNLQELFILQNSLKGQIPATIGRLTKLEYLTLAENLFSGTLPEELNLLTNVLVLSLGGRFENQTNALTGPLLSFRSLRSLNTLYLNNNMLTGTIPVDFLDGVTNKYGSIEVDLESNRLQGTVPSSLIQFQALNIILAGNMLTGLPTALCNQKQWMNGLVGNYSCNAILCPPGTYSLYGYSYDSESECQSCPSSPFYGSYKCKSADEIAADEEVNSLIDFFRAMNGKNWDSNAGWLDFSQSICDWTGISCSSSGRVEGISLPYLGLDGSVPSSFFHLEKLKYINLSGNYISIDLRNAASLKSLVTLNLDDTGLSSITGITSTNIQSIHIAYNQFSSFPAEILSMTSLQVLSMSNNPIAGAIPTDISKLTSLFYFSCNSCGFQGTIPSLLGSKNMTYLSLANNKLTGSIPPTIASLSNLQYIDLSSQTPRGGGISGSVPEFKSTSLSQIFLSKNKLSGPIPLDFLNFSTARALQIDLRSNTITGSIPTSLRQLTDVTILLSDNQITKISDSLCFSNSTWNGGDVARFNCSGILCPPTTYNALGRQTLGFYGDCMPCPDLMKSKIYGSTTCGSQQTPEYTLTKFYLELNGDSWTANDYWLESPNVCLWYGVGCDSNGAVVSISLEANGLVGNVPPDIYNFTALTSIDLKGNEINFLFTGIEKLTSLETLILSSTGLTDISGIGKAISLKSLVLTSNSLVSLPSEIYGLSNLQSLMLNYNGIAGTLPSALGKLTNLQSFYLYHNKVVGSIPSQIGYLSNLSIFSVGENFLNGPIPSELNYLRKLEKLSLDRQGQVDANANANTMSRALAENTVGFTGNIPSLHLSPYLQEVYIGNCNLIGSIPNNFLAGIDDYKSLITVDLSGNHITGTLPSSLKRFGNLNLIIAGNQISDIDESFCYQSGWMNGLVGLYGCDAFACPKGSYNVYGRQISDAVMCIPCPYISSALNYGSTTCIPDGKVYSEKDILKLFYNSAGGATWKRRTNWMSEKLSVCEWFGVTCNEQRNVASLSLPSNNLVGTVTPYIFGLKYMRVLKLSDNKIDLPLIGIGSAVSLEEIYIDRTSISSLRGIDQAQTLKIFQSQFNNFFGARIPLGLFDLQSLEILQLSDCHFGGPVPSQIGKLINLKEFWCHDNDLTGTIPSQIGFLQNLKILSLSENKLFGTLPTEIGYLQSLESIFIDHFTRPGAGLSGPLPSLSNAPLLSEIYLNSNTLTGRIPIDFLSGIVDNSRKIVVGLRSNRIDGTVPGELARFDQLNIDLADNWVSGINPRICFKSKWMDGLVGSFGCDAILCPIATANRYGRKTTKSSSCDICATNDSGDSYFGTVQCLADVKAKERAILTKLYNSCGGKKWFKSDNWLNKNIDICDWYGISCKPGGSIQAILLGSNNLSGSPPRELFDIKNLEWLWLYSNPINFNFAGIENAIQLQSLLLGSTGLRSLDGIKGAFELKELDIRFNSLSGPFPTELLQLVNLESLLMSNNALTGSIPTMAALSNLKILQLGGNLFSGKLNSFSTMGSLTTLDISDNKLSGTMPRNFLFSAPIDSKIFVDLSNNLIEGTIPAELGRFNYASLYLQDNFISGISSNLCSMASWNDGDVGSYDCSGILCPSQTFAVGSGRAGSNNTQCLLCGMAKYYGQTKCVDLKASKSTNGKSTAQGSRVIRGVLIGIGVLISGVIIAYAIYRYKYGREY